MNPLARSGFQLGRNVDFGFFFGREVSGWRRLGFVALIDSTVAGRRITVGQARASSIYSLQLFRADQHCFPSLPPHPLPLTSFPRLGLAHMLNCVQGQGSLAEKTARASSVFRCGVFGATGRFEFVLAAISWPLTQSNRYSGPLNPFF